MKPKIFCKFGRLKNQVFHMGANTYIGRAQTNQVVLPLKSISTKHARIFKDGAHYFIEDLGSLNGTTLDGIPITEAEQLGHLHVINFGGAVDFFFVHALAYTPVKSLEPEAKAPLAQPQPGTPLPPSPKKDESSTHFGPSPAPLPPSLGKPVMPPKKDETFMGKDDRIPIPKALFWKINPPQASNAPDQQLELTAKHSSPYAIVVTNAADHPVILPLEEGDNMIGRTSDLKLRIDHEEISRRHATISVKGEDVQIRDEGSLNHTFVEGRPIRVSCTLKAGQAFQLGKIEARLERMENLRPSPAAPKIGGKRVEP